MAEPELKYNNKVILLPNESFIAQELTCVAIAVYSSELSHNTKNLQDVYDQEVITTLILLSVQNSQAVKTGVAFKSLGEKVEKSKLVAKK